MSCVFGQEFLRLHMIMAEGSNFKFLSAKGSVFESKITDELENLNLRIASINELEQEAGRAERSYEDKMEESFEALKNCANKIGIEVLEAARPYFKLVKRVQKADEKVKIHATAHERANDYWFEMKSKLMQIEERIMQTSGSQELEIEGLEILNQAVEDVVKAVDLKCKYLMELREFEMNLALMQKKLSKLQDSLRCEIVKARPYFELKNTLNMELRHQKELVDNIRRCLYRAKREYYETMGNVERISEQIHLERELLETRTDG